MPHLQQHKLWPSRVSFIALLRFASAIGLLAVLTGAVVAFFLWLLTEATALRTADWRWSWLLPLAGILLGWVYQRYGGLAQRGNRLLIDEYHRPQARIPLRMAPIVLFGTVLTHLVGGSAGREGTAVQIGGALSDQLARWWRLPEEKRRILLLSGIAAGFGAVFGTPWAGAVFAIEVMRHWHWPRKAVLPVLAAAWLAHLSCVALGASHAAYPLPTLPGLHLQWLGYSSLAGLAFGLAAWLFIALDHLQARYYQRWLPDARWRGFLGGFLLLAIIWWFEPSRYLGLGLPVIEAAFESTQLPYDFLLKILFTTFTLAVGFKGGEVTPLFFIGATLGNALVWWLPLPLPLLAGMGFVAVFAGATNTPLACVVMGIELFGWPAAPYLSVACGLAYLFSGKKSIYR